MKSLTIIFLILLSFESLFAQHANNSFQDSLLMLENRIWRMEDREEKNNLYFLKARLYIQHGHYDEAIQTYSRMQRTFLSDSMLHVSIYQQALCNFLSGHTEDAYELAQQDSLWMIRTSTSRLLYTMILIENKRWISAKQLLLSDTAGISNILIDSIRSLPDAIRYKNPYRLGQLSAFLPGAGQWKAGYTGKAVLSIGLHLSFAGFIVYQALGGYYVTAVVSGILPLLKFYRGNKQLAESLAMRKNKQLEEGLEDKYRKVLSSLSSKKFF